MTRTLLLLVLFASTCCGAERYFAPAKFRNFGITLGFHGLSPVLRHSTADIDVSFDGMKSVTIHEATYFYRDQDTQPPRELDGEPLELFSEITFAEVTAPLLVPLGPTAADCSDPRRTCTPVPPNTYFASHLPLPVSVRIYGSHGDKEFDQDIDMKDIDIRFNQTSLTVVFDEVGEVVYFGTGPSFGLEDVDIGLGKVDFGSGPIWLHFKGFGVHEELERVPTPAQRAVYLPGDADLDGEVAFADFLALSTYYGGRGTWGHGDFNGDRKVDFADFLVLADGFGSARSSNIAVVPEPTARHVGLLAFFLVLYVINQGFRER